MQNFQEICVGVTTYNGEKTLEKTLVSLEEQPFKNFSVLISDDGSTDNTINIIKSFVKRNKNFFYKVNEKKIKMIVNNNKVFLESNSKYFTWVDHADYRETESFISLCTHRCKK